MVSLKKLMGGAEYHSFGLNLTFTRGAAKVQVLAATAANLSVILPSTFTWPQTESNQYIILNVGSNAFWVEYLAAATSQYYSISASSADNSYNAGSGLAIVPAAEWIDVSGFVNAANNGRFQVIRRVQGGTKVIVNHTLVDETVNASLLGSPQVTVTRKKIVSISPGNCALLMNGLSGTRSNTTREWYYVQYPYGAARPMTWIMPGGGGGGGSPGVCASPGSYTFQVSGTLVTGDHAYPGGGSLPQPPGGALPVLTYIGSNTWYATVSSGVQTWSATLQLSCPGTNPPGLLGLVFSDPTGNYVGDYTCNPTSNGGGVYSGPEAGVTPLTQTVSAIGGGGGGGGGGGHTSVCVVSTPPPPPPPPPPYDGSSPIDMSACPASFTVTVSGGTGAGAIWNGVWTVTRQTGGGVYYYRRIIDNAHWIDIRGYPGGGGYGYKWQVICDDLTNTVSKRFGNTSTAGCPPLGSYTCFPVAAENANCSTGGTLSCVVSA